MPPPLGAPGILALCSHCRQLEVLDLGEVPGLEDSAMVGFNDYEMVKLEKVSRGVSPHELLDAHVVLWSRVRERATVQ